MKWKDALLDGVATTSSRTHRSGPRSHPWVGILIRVHPEVHRRVSAIASKRGVSTSTFVRRLLIMAIAKETGEPLQVWLDRLPEPMTPNNTHIRMLQPHLGTDTGEGMEGMCTHPGCDLVHW